MIKINLKRKECYSKINSYLLKQKQAFRVEPQNQVYFILGEPKNKNLIDWFLSLDPECIITYANDFDTDPEVLNWICDVNENIFDRPKEKYIHYFNQIEEFKDARLTSAFDFTEDVCTKIFGDRRTFKPMFDIFYRAIVCDVSISSESMKMSKEHQQMFDYYLKEFLKSNNYKSIKIYEFFKLANRYYKDNCEE